MDAPVVIPFEPNKDVYSILISNVLVNKLQNKFVLDNLGVGVSDKNDTGFAVQKRNRNQGAAKMVSGAGDLDVVRGDDVLKNIEPDMIKIDVEGMEMKALYGLEDVIKRSRPLLFVEVDQENDDAFKEWVEANNYTLAHTQQRYRINKNYLLVAVCIPM